MEQPPVKLLSEVGAGKTVRISSVEAAYGLRGRLAAMGLLPNQRITVIKNGRPGPLVVNVKGSRVVLGRGMAHKIMVTS